MLAIVPWLLVAQLQRASFFSHALAHCRVVDVPRSLWLVPRGGSSHDNRKNGEWSESRAFAKQITNVTIAQYVAAMEQKDANDRSDGPDHNNDEPTSSLSLATNSEVDKTALGRKENKEEAAAVGVKSHSKKSNAVGDPDGEGSSDDSDDGEGSEWEELEDLDLVLDPTTQMQVDFELVEDEHDDDEIVLDEHDDDEDEDDRSPRSGGGVGVRLGSRLSRRRNRKEWNQSTSPKLHVNHEKLLLAWQPYVYIPPPPAALAYLTDHARALDGASKTRLDRRTLYACLLLEWLHVSTTYRRFLDKSTSQTLQSALSLASQPQWRKAFPRPNGIRFYDKDTVDRGCTLAMQETVALALVRDHLSLIHRCYLVLLLVSNFFGSLTLLLGRPIRSEQEWLFWTIPRCLLCDKICCNKGMQRKTSNLLCSFSPCWS
jgi:hypothetical protein